MGKKKKTFQLLIQNTVIRLINQHQGNVRIQGMLIFVWVHFLGTQTVLNVLKCKSEMVMSLSKPNI